MSSPPRNTWGKPGVRANPRGTPDACYLEPQIAKSLRCGLERGVRGRPRRDADANHPTQSPNFGGLGPQTNREETGGAGRTKEPPTKRGGTNHRDPPRKRKPPTAPDPQTGRARPDRPTRKKTRGRAPPPGRIHSEPTSVHLGSSPPLFTFLYSGRPARGQLSWRVARQLTDSLGSRRLRSPLVQDGGAILEQHSSWQAYLGA